MSALRLDDTIVAVATAPGEGAVGMVRLSGPEALSILGQLFRRPSRDGRPGPPRRTFRSRRLYYGYIVDSVNDRIVDEVLAAYMRAPHTYTRQDVVEITGHGGGAGVREITRLAIGAGARPAERGELTLRAFLNGRIDLAQAEAVLDAVQARTATGLSLAVHQLAGGLSRHVSALRERLLAVYAHLEATIDFTEDEVPPPSDEDLLEPMRRAHADLHMLLATARSGQLHREGIRVAITGRPNAGKSSLLNALLQADRAIVTPIPGTTRDVIEESIDLQGVPAVLLDTAGIVETDDPVERIGVERSRRVLETADVVLLVVDGSQSLEAADREVAALVQRRHGAALGASALVLSKADLAPAVGEIEARDLLPEAPVLRVSSITGMGLDALRTTIRQLAGAGGNGIGSRWDSPVVTSARHRDALERAARALAEAIDSVRQGLPADCICIDLRAALTALGEITGESVTEDLLENIFARFCIGK